MAKEKQLYDVFVYKISDGVICTLAGDNMPVKGSFHTVSKRIDTVLERLNDAYSATITEAGQYKVGDVLAEKDRGIHRVEED